MKSAKGRLRGLRCNERVSEEMGKRRKVNGRWRRGNKVSLQLAHESVQRCSGAAGLAWTSEINGLGALSGEVVASHGSAKGPSKAQSAIRAAAVEVKRGKTKVIRSTAHIFAWHLSAGACAMCYARYLVFKYRVQTRLLESELRWFSCIFQFKDRTAGF